MQIDAKFAGPSLRARASRACNLPGFPKTTWLGFTPRIRSPSARIREVAGSLSCSATWSASTSRRWGSSSSGRSRPTIVAAFASSPEFHSAILIRPLPTGCLRCLRRAAAGSQARHDDRLDPSPRARHGGGTSRRTRSREPRRARGRARRTAPGWSSFLQAASTCWGSSPPVRAGLSSWGWDGAAPDFDRTGAKPRCPAQRRRRGPFRLRRRVLRAAEAPLDLAGREALAANRGVSLEKLAEFLRSLREEGLLEGAV